ncbi:MAG: FlgD immunoglobulin-like domain containing protein [Candidatus Zixiibacteriota bacterium]
MRHKALFLLVGLCLVLTLPGSSLGNSLPNEPPSIQLSPDASVSICPGDSVCLAIFASDPDPKDSITVEMISGAGVYNPVTDTTPIFDTHCFYPNTSGKYTFIFKVTDKGGLWDTDTTELTVDVDQPPVIIAPDTLKFNLCDTATVCFRITIIDPGDWITFEVTYPGHIISCQGYPELCFHAYTDTTYNFTIIATDMCGMSDTAYTTVIVNINDAPVITAPDTVKYDLGDTATFCFDVTLDDPGDSLEVWVNPPGQFNPNDSSICFFADRDTTYDFIIIVTDTCGIKDTAYTAAVVSSSNKPVVTAPDTVEYSLCDTATFCFDITIFDPDGLVADVWVSSPGVYNSQDTTICFFADKGTTYDFTIIIEDTDGLKDTAYTTAIVDFNDPPQITFPADLDTLLCEAETLCFMIEATDPDPNDSMILEKIEGPGDFVPDTGLSPLSGKHCFLPDELDSTYRFIFRVTDHCSVFDQDTFYAIVSLNDPPTVVVPPDTSIFLAEPETLCFKIEITDPENKADVDVNLPWYFDSQDTSICLHASSQMTYCCTVIVRDHCEEADTAIFCATIDFDKPPTVEVLSPPSGDTLAYLPTLNIRLKDDVGLNRGYYQIDSCTGDWTELWSYNSNSSDTTIDWTVPSVSEGEHTIYFKVTDDGGMVNVDTCSYFWSFTLQVPVISIIPDLLLAQCDRDYIFWIHLDEKVADLDSAFFKVNYEDKYVTATAVGKGPALTPATNYDVSRVIHSDSIHISLSVKSGTIDGPGSVLGVYIRPGNQQVSTQLSIAYCTLLDSEGHELVYQTKGATIKITCPVDVEEGEETDLIPSAYGLGQNYPNPYNLKTQIGYQLPEAGKVTLTIYNVRGRLVRTLVNEQKPAGYHSVVWDGRTDNGMQVSSGIYFYRIQAGKFLKTKKMVLLK